MERKDRGYETDERIMEAIEAVTGASLECDCDYCTNGNSNMCENPAVQEWHNGRKMAEIAAYLDEHCDGWRGDSIFWGQHDFRKELAQA